MIALYRNLYNKYRHFIPPSALAAVLAIFLLSRPLYAARTWLYPAFCNAILWLSWQDQLLMPMPTGLNKDAELGFVFICAISTILQLVVLGFSIFGIVQLFQWAYKKSK